MKPILLIIPIVAMIVTGCTRRTLSEMNPTPTPTENPNPTPAELNDLIPGMTPSPENGVVVGGAVMSPDETLIDNAKKSADHQTLVSIVETAGLTGTLETAGPFTVFAPTDAAFEKLPAGTVDNWLKPANKAGLTKVLTYHAVPARYTTAELKHNLKLKTIQGQELTILQADGNWFVQDASGNKAQIEIADVPSSNGITFVIDTVLMPK